MSENTENRQTDLPEKWQHHENRVVEMVRKGAKVYEITNSLGVARDTLRDWRNKFDVIDQAIINAENDRIDAIEKELCDIAQGHSWEETTEKMTARGIEKTVRKGRNAGNITAIKFVLTNRRPDKWSDKTTAELTGAGGEPLNTNTGISHDEAKGMIERIAEKREEAKRKHSKDS